MKQLSEDRIREMRKVRDDLIGGFGARDTMFDRYEEIYFMARGERPRGLKGTDDNDIKETISSSGRDAVTGLKRILDSGAVHIKVKGTGNSDKIEAGLKKMLSVSGEYRLSNVDNDLNLSTSLYGPGVLSVDLVDDLLETIKNPQAEGGEPMPKYKNEYVAKQLELVKRKTPFLFDTVNPRQSYPLFGGYGMIGHARKYKLKGAEVTDRWGVECDPNMDYEIKDFFYYTDRLVEADGISDPLMAAEWVARDPKTGEMIGSINIPVFTRYAGGTSLFNEVDKQSQPLLYAKAKGNWDLRENLYYTYLFTAIYQQGLPGPLLLVKPESANQEIEVSYNRGVRSIVADGQLADPQVIDGDVMQLGNILEGQAAMQTIQPQTLGQNTAGVTFSQFALAAKSGLIPAVDPKESKEALYKDAFTHILQRIKEENIENDLITAADIPEHIDLEVTIEPDLEQDDLRNAQIALQLTQAGLGSREWIDTNILKIADSKEIWKQRKLEEMRDAMVEMLKNPEVLQQYMANVMPKAKPTPANGEVPPTMPDGNMPEMPGMQPGNMQGMMPGSGMEQMPQTDAMIPQNERR